jgi:hypothetical protein
MKIDISTLKKLSGVIKVAGALVSLGIIFKYDKLRSEDYIKIGKIYDWENR